MRDVFLRDATMGLFVVTQKPQCGVLKSKCDYLSRLSVLMCTPLKVWAGLSGGVCRANHPSLRRNLLESSSSVREDCSRSDEMQTV